MAGYRVVRDADLARTSGLFVAEGRHIVRRVVEDGRYRVQSVLLNEPALRDLESLFASTGVDVPIFVSAATALAEIAGYDVHRGCLALVQRPALLPVDELLAAATTLVVIEAVTNADNVGGIFRNAAAFGAGGVLLSPTSCDPLYRKAIRTSMGATLRMPFARTETACWPSVLSRVKAAGFTTIALTPREPSDTLDVFAGRPRAARIALIVGTEGAGLSVEAEDAADYRVRIPIAPGVDSLNVAVAAGIALHALRWPLRAC
ncbi:MAG: TrmH family RNA methyltransferase [Vicinamibacterales bacterium]